jgi:hypothetical protein
MGFSQTMSSIILKKVLSPEKPVEENGEFVVNS